MPHPIADRYTLTPPARAFLIDHPWAAHALVPPPLGPVVSTANRRATLVDLEATARVTLDVEFVCAGAGRRVSGLHAHVLVETKGSDTKGRADRLLQRTRTAGHAGQQVRDRGRPALPGDDRQPLARTLRRYFRTQATRLRVWGGPGG